MNEVREKFLHKLYSEIIAGFSIYSLESNTVYIKHLTSVDNLEIDYFYTLYYDKLIKKGVFSREERLAKIIEDGLWSNEKEKEILHCQDVIRDLGENKRKVFTRADFDSFDAQIKEWENKLFVLLGEKFMLLGQCAEDKAQERVSYLSLQKSLFRDNELKHYCIQRDELNELDDEVSSKYFHLFSQFNSDYSLNNVKSVALCNFFQNSYHLASSAFEFYGIPIVKLSEYQTTLINYGSYYKTILASSPPQKYIDDPIQLENWFNGKRNIDELVEKQERDGGNLSIPGATRSDIEDYGYTMDAPIADKLAKEVNQETGEVDMAAMFKLGILK